VPKDGHSTAWASYEAAERIRRRANGEEVVFGVNYAGVRFLEGSRAIDKEQAEAIRSGQEAGPLFEKAPLKSTRTL
jgi:hypothetical protein